MSNEIDGSYLEQKIAQVNSGGLMAPRADFRPEMFNTAIMQKGYRIKWEQGMFCSCYNKQSGQPDYGCPTCKGKGYIYFEPTEIRALVTSINGHKDQGKIGLDEMGTAYLTPQSTDNIGFRDRFTFMDFVTKMSEVLRRDEYNDNVLTDELRYPAMNVLMVRALDQEYKRGRDFQISKDGRHLIWNEDTMYAGTAYSVLYTTYPVYVAMGPIHELRGTYSLAKAGGLEAFHQLPKQYQIKREDFLE